MSHVIAGISQLVGYECTDDAGNWVPCVALAMVMTPGRIAGFPQTIVAPTYLNSDGDLVAKPNSKLRKCGHDTKAET